jgi:hypothetical protein
MACRPCWIKASPLVDELFTEGLGEYLTPSPELLKSMTTGQPPFNHVDLLLAAHAHGENGLATCTRWPGWKDAGWTGELPPFTVK